MTYEQVRRAFGKFWNNEAKVVQEPRPTMQVRTFTYKRQGRMTRSFGAAGDTYYLGAETMDMHVARMLENGWELVNSSADSGHVRIGRTLVGATLTGGLSLLAGGSRTGPSVTLTFKHN